MSGEEREVGADGTVDKARLARLVGLRREITRTKKRIAVLERRLAVTDATDASDAEQAATLALREALCDKRDALMHYLHAAAREETLLIRYIEAIPDSDVRELFMLRYVDGVRSWQRIAFLAGEHDESYVRRKHNRYIRKA